MINILGILEPARWRIIDDGWFTYYACSNCGHKLKLVQEGNDILPEKCPNCKMFMKEELL